MVDSPVPTLLFTALYLFLVWIGPKYMEKRNPFKLTPLLVPYNMAMAVLNGYIASQVMSYLILIPLMVKMSFSVAYSINKTEVQLYL